MFSKKTMVVAGAIILIVLNGIVFSFNYIRKPAFQSAATQTVLFFVAPFQETVSQTIGFADSVWTNYFNLVSAARENADLRMQLARARQKLHACKETAAENTRLKRFVDFKSNTDFSMVAAEVVAKDPSPWYRTVIVNKGATDGIETGQPVVVPDGIVGQVTAVSNEYAKVLLLVDRNSAVDALIQRTRARGLVRGLSERMCKFEYALRKLDIDVGDTVITSGFDAIYPKGLRIGRVTKVLRRNSGIFQEIEITPFVDFHKLEEVMIILNPPEIGSVEEQ
ncbi:MAG: rod shape-determining protein MreC [Thermodesulfobacteriota bacterium]